jgi:hypothetical protein
MKCIPITLSDLFVELASSVIEIDEVLLAIIASGFRMLSREERRDFLTFAFYKIAFQIIKKIPQPQSQHPLP